MREHVERYIQNEHSAVFISRHFPECCKKIVCFVHMSTGGALSGILYFEKVVSFVAACVID